MNNLSHTVLTGAGTVKNGTKGGAFSSGFSNDFDIGGDFSPADFDTGLPDGVVRRAALRLVGSEKDRRQELFELMVDYAKATPEWSRTLTDPETDRWEGQLKGYADRVNELTACPFTDATTTELAAALARGCGKFSLLPSQQRMRAYKRAAKVRERNAKRNASILHDRAAGVSIRKLAARYRLSRGGVLHVLQGGRSTANRPLVDNSISTANRTLERPVCRPSESSSITTDEVVSRPPLEGAKGHVPAVSKRENEDAPNTKAGGGRGGGNPPFTATAPADATSHPGRTRPPETEAASGGAPRRGPEVGQRLDEVLQSLVDSKRSVHEVPPDAKHITDPAKIVEREERRRQWSTQASALTGLQAGPEVGEGSRE